MRIFAPRIQCLFASIGARSRASNNIERWGVKRMNIEMVVKCRATGEFRKYAQYFLVFRGRTYGVRHKGGDIYRADEVDNIGRLKLPGLEELSVLEEITPSNLSPTFQHDLGIYEKLPDGVVLAWQSKSCKWVSLDDYYEVDSIKTTSGSAHPYLIERAKNGAKGYYLLSDGESCVLYSGEKEKEKCTLVDGEIAHYGMDNSPEWRCRIREEGVVRWCLVQWKEIVTNIGGKAKVKGIRSAVKILEEPVG